MIDTLVVFGAGGDLTGRLLLPALVALRVAGELDADLRIVATDLAERTAEDFAQHVRARLAAHAPSTPEPDREAVVTAVRYRAADVRDPDAVADVLDAAGPGPVVVYLALPTWLMPDAVRAVLAHGLPPGSRLAVEKPFGTDGESAAELEAALAPAVDAQLTVYRVDHALAMTAVQRLREPRVPGTDVGWGSRAIAQVDLLWEETLALEGRASFYDRAGALRDVVQNHLVQLLCAVARPRSPGRGDGADGDGDGDGDDPARQRADVLRTVRPIESAQAATRTRRARYTAGPPAGTDGADARRVPDYVDEPGVDSARRTETFAQIVLELDSPQWTGTRFVLRAGKALAARRRGVRVHLRPQDGATPDPIWLDLDADADDDADRPGVLVEAEPAAYRRILADLLGDGIEFAVGAVEVELAWRIITPVLQAWAAELVPLESYPAGSEP